MEQNGALWSRKVIWEIYHILTGALCPGMSVLTGLRIHLEDKFLISQIVLTSQNVRHVVNAINNVSTGQIWYFKRKKVK